MANPPITVRASAPLAAAGAYDAAPTAIPVGNATVGELCWTYTRGAAGGQPKFKIIVTPTTGVAYERTVDQGTLVVSGGEAVSSLFTGAKLIPVPAGAGAESRSYLFDVSTVQSVQIAFAEVGNVGSPGTLGAVLVLSNL